MEEKFPEKIVFRPKVELVRELRAWINKQSDKPSVSAAIRMLLWRALESEKLRG